MLAWIAWVSLQLPASRGTDGLTHEERERKALIQREFGDEDLPDWAGRYTGLMIAPRNGFEFESPSCMGPIVSFGSVRAEGRRLELTFEEEPSIPTVWWSVPWGERMYLIQDWSMREFCALVNDGTEPRTNSGGWPAMRPYDPGRLAPGRPQVPARWQPLLLDHPITARVLRIDRRAVVPLRRYDPETETRIMLHVGTRDGVQLDLGFHFGKGPSVRGFVESVDSTACIVRLTELSESLSDRIAPGDFAGTQMTPR